MELTFTNDLEPLLATVAKQFAFEGAACEVDILVNAISHVSWCCQEYDIDYYCLVLQIPGELYSQITENVQQYEAQILAKVQEVIKSHSEGLKYVNITPILSAEEGWREKLNNWLKGNGVNNQGRVRSNNIASKEEDGLLFRSNNEIFFYEALKSTGVPFAPLPVFIRGGNTYQRIEPDFVIIKDGVMVVVEIGSDK